MIENPQLPIAQRTSGLAIASLVTALLCVPLTPIILGHTARSGIKKDPQLGGGGLALAGLIIGYIQLVAILGFLLLKLPAVLGAANSSLDKSGQSLVSESIESVANDSSETVVTEGGEPERANEPPTPKRRRALRVFSDETQNRLEREGAEVGEIEIALSWDNRNDIDLSCKDPKGELIYFGNKRSRSRGELDVDMNVVYRRTVTNPVEHIRWLSGDALEGKYEIYVHHFRQHVADTKSTSFAIEVKIGKQVKSLKGWVRYPGPPKLVATFVYKQDYVR